MRIAGDCEYRKARVTCKRAECVEPVGKICAAAENANDGGTAPCKLASNRSFVAEIARSENANDGKAGR